MAEAELKEHSGSMENEQSTTTSSASSTTSTATTSAASSSSSSLRTQPPQISVYSGSDRHAVQVIQQALHRPSSAAQYLQQMYAAQQQHLMLQTAALQQQHLSSTQLQSLATVQQAHWGAVRAPELSSCRYFGNGASGLGTGTRLRGRRSPGDKKQRRRRTVAGVRNREIMFIKSSMSGGRRSTSPTRSVTQQSSMSQTSINLSTSPTPAQLMSRSQASSTTSSSITQQTMLLGSSSPTLTASQAQMYLRAQMLIFTPAATVAAVQSDIPVVSSSSSSSSSCQSAATQVQNLTLRGQQNGPPKTIGQSQPLAINHKTTASISKVSQPDLSPESNKKGESPGPESRSTAVTRPSSVHPLIAPTSYAPMQPHSMIKHQQIPLPPTPPKMSHQYILQQQQIQNRQQQMQPIALHNSAAEPVVSQHCCAHGGLPVSSSVQSQHCSPVHTHAPPLTASPTQPQSTQQSVVVSPPTHSPSQSPTIIIHPQTLLQPQSHALMSPVLHSGPNPQQSTCNQVQPTQELNPPSHLPLPPSPVAHVGQMQQPNVVSSGQHSLPSPVLGPPQLSTSSPAQMQALPLQSVQTVGVQPEMLSPGHMMMQNALISEEELPAAEALVQLPFQTLPPPQTIAVNLQVQPSAPVETPAVYQVENMCEEQMPEVAEDCNHIMRTPTPPTLSPPPLFTENGEELPVEDTSSEHVGIPIVASSVSASVIKSPSDPLHASIPPPPLLLPAATTRSNSTLMPNSIPSIEAKLPQAVVKPQILTHVIEGFVIQEGLEPFPVSRSSLLIEQPVKRRPHPEDQVTGISCVPSELQSTAKHPENSTDTDMEDIAAEEALEEMEPELLKCEFCGKMGYSNTFLRSKRFCTMSCAKRYNVNCSKRLGIFKSDKTSRWSRKQDGPSLSRRGRRPSGSEGAVREHFLRQLPIPYPPTDDVLVTSHEDPVPAAMTTRLRRQNERERERERRELRIRKTPNSIDLLPDAQTDPALWTVDEVWAFIHSLPGCQDIANEFRAQEIDGQALLLLKEDHLMSAMNIKLGPALKICARINSLKET
ncbi:polyhomeotic-like protein 3 isoform X3 [Rhinatrema bivittatum]|uniref:polyhomeotic-like protein 3 isoform X3 n=1 Tax=Rhinatrema bivittatum TaxID=194408 RepID=UPI00112921D4|nr:polyhomeotic-like protein 3 isoform X3 [Rhinatrema bivittatum]